jgi:hypothetical protein
MVRNLQKGPKMSADKQYSDARQALDLIEREVLSPGKYLTYGNLADKLGYDAGDYGRHIGQVCSLIDAACYWARLPMLSLEKVRLDGGDYNPASFSGAYDAVKGSLIANASSRGWSSDDIIKIKKSLTHMNDEGAIKQWERIESFGQKGLDRISSYR